MNSCNKSFVKEHRVQAVLFHRQLRAESSRGETKRSTRVASHVAENSVEAAVGIEVKGNGRFPSPPGGRAPSIGVYFNIVLGYGIQG